LEGQLNKVDSQVRIQRADLKDLIRDEVYGAAIANPANAASSLLILRKEDVKKLAKRIANRAIIGH
jgi:hypothetical protein